MFEMVTVYSRVSSGSGRLPLRSWTVFLAMSSVLANPENLRLSMNAQLSNWLSPSSLISNVTVICSRGETGCSLPTRAVAPPSAPVGLGVVVTQSTLSGFPLVAKTSKLVPGMSCALSTKSPPFTSMV